LSSPGRAQEKEITRQGELAIFYAEARCPLTRLPTMQSSGGTLAGTADAIEDSVKLVIEAVAHAAEERRLDGRRFWTRS
jgi:hypothetical protein